MGKTLRVFRHEFLNMITKTGYIIITFIVLLLPLLFLFAYGIFAHVQGSRETTVEETSTISGSRVLPFLTIGHEGFDVNCEIDWTIAQILSQRGEAPLSQVRT